MPFLGDSPEAWILLNVGSVILFAQIQIVSGNQQPSHHIPLPKWVAFHIRIDVAVFMFRSWICATSPWSGEHSANQDLVALSKLAEVWWDPSQVMALCPLESATDGDEPKGTDKQRDDLRWEEDVPVPSKDTLHII